jgi:hypothetical protein
MPRAVTPALVIAMGLGACGGERPAPARPRPDGAAQIANDRPVCGFTDFAALDAAIVAAARGYTYQVQRPPGDRTKWGPSGKPPPLGPPRAVGSCLLHATNVLVGRYELRDRSSPVAELWDTGLVLRVPGFAFDGVSVGTSAEHALPGVRGAHPLVCAPTGLGNFCRYGEFDGTGIDYVIAGELDAELTGPAAIAFVRGKRIAGINVYHP